MKQVEQIIELLGDTSFPQVLLIDGAWGSGKTYFVNNHLLKKIEACFSQKTYFFSLYGISNIDDFRDKIISLSLTEKEEASVFAKYFAKAIDGTANNLGEKGIGAILSAVAGAYKYKLYGELDNCVLVLDDLERVNNETLIKNILGECLNLAESKNIKIVIVANEDKLTCKDDIEKVFADKYKFSFTHEEVIKILKEEYSNINEMLANEILLNITSLNSKNIRVLKRAISKFTRIQEEVSKINGVVLEQALSRILSDIIRVCCAKFEYGFSKEQIIDAIDSRIIRQMNKSKQKIECSDYEKLDTIFSEIFNGANKKLISYCCDGLYEFSDLKVELNLPMRQSLLDAMQSRWVQNQLTKEEFNKGVALLENFIYKEANVDIYEWFNICDTYIQMLDKKVIHATKHTKASLLGMCDTVDIDRFKVSTAEESLDYKHRISFYDSEVSQKFYLKKKELDILQNTNKNSKFSQELQLSWANVENEAHQDLMHKPIFHNISVDTMETAFRHWSNEDVFQFVRFITKRYEFSNIEDFFESEIEALKDISKMVATLQREFEVGLKVASLGELYDCLVDVYFRMEKNISDKKKC